MRIYLIAVAAGLALAPVSTIACEYSLNAVEASVPAEATPVAAVQTPVADDLSAKAKKEKVEYMKSAAGPEPAPPKKMKKKK